MKTYKQARDNRGNYVVTDGKMFYGFLTPASLSQIKDKKFIHFIKSEIEELGINNIPEDQWVELK